VLWFDSPSDAVRDGFRACLRCWAPPRSLAPVCRRLESNERATLAELGRIANLSPFHLQRLFKREFGVTPREYGAFVRARPGARSLRYAIARSPLGPLLAATTERGLCVVRFEGTSAWLRREFPTATITHDRTGLQSVLAALLRHLRTGRERLDLPLDIRATAFEARVWKELRRLRPGTTTSYADIARRIGKPLAVRAVGRACANNRVALVIPCHRVVRSDGGLAGYRWGVERKRRLLEIENKLPRSRADRV
jgi:AraC family transcriptional regulator of adaptative response/methylated-DNA-[protein]-cysteine methyltransferase